MQGHHSRASPGQSFFQRAVMLLRGALVCWWVEGGLGGGPTAIRRGSFLGCRGRRGGIAVAVGGPRCWRTCLLESGGVWSVVGVLRAWNRVCSCRRLIRRRCRKSIRDLLCVDCSK